MNTIFSTNQIVENIREGNEDWEVFASAEAGYDSQESKVEIVLDAFLRSPLGRAEETWRVEWLPRRNRVVEHCSRSEAIQVTQDVFVNWVKRVRRAISVDQVLSVTEAPKLYLSHSGLVYT